MIYAIHKVTKEHSVVPKLDADWRYIQADDDGWIPHDGRECPLPVSAACDVRHADGEVFEDTRPGGPGAIRWQHADKAGDIIAYRPLLDAAEPEPPEWDGVSWPPPIGSIIESSATWEDGTPAEVLAVRNGKVIGCHVETGVAGWLEREHCRPLNTAEPEQPEWKNGLPPVNGECEYLYSEGNEWRRGRCAAHYRGRAVIVDTQDYGSECLPPQRVRPLRTAEDKAVEEMRRVTAEDTEAPSHYHALYRAGYRKEESK